MPQTPEETRQSFRPIHIEDVEMVWIREKIKKHIENNPDFKNLDRNVQDWIIEDFLIAAETFYFQGLNDVVNCFVDAADTLFNIFRSKSDVALFSSLKAKMVCKFFTRMIRMKSAYKRIRHRGSGFGETPIGRMHACIANNGLLSQIPPEEYEVYMGELDKILQEQVSSIQPTRNPQS